MSQSAVAVLSGGLDSTVSLAVAMDMYHVNRAIFFNYGQLSFQKELCAVENICKYYKIPYQVINLDWLKEITKTSLVNSAEEIPEYTVEQLDSDEEVLKQSAKAVWIPNRNGVMLNIAAAIAESENAQAVIFGANAEEAVTFPDNSKEYVDSLTKAFSYSTNNAVDVFAPLVNKTKSEIVKIAQSYSVPLHYLWSCYCAKEKHCGKCEACVRLERALLSNNKLDLWEKMSELCK